MKRTILMTMVLAFLTVSLQGMAQETKTKEKSATGEKAKTKAEDGKTKAKSETADGQEAKMKKEDDKVVLKGEGVGGQFDTAMNKTSGINLDVVRQEINNANQLFGQAFVRGDSVTMVGLYHSQALLYPPNAAMMNNRTEIGRMISAMPRGSVQRMQLTTTDVIGGQDLVVESGTFE